VERLLTPEERQTLLDAYPTRDGVVHVERAAIAFEEYMLGELQAKPAVRRIFAKIANFLRQLGNALRGRGFRTVEDVFERAASGEIGARFREGPPAGATTVDPDTGRPVSRFAKPPEDIQRVVAAGATLLRPVNAQTLGMVRAYHGSPHRFDRFSMEKIGAGEGA